MYRPEMIFATFSMKTCTMQMVLIIVSLFIALMPKLTQTIIHDELAKPAALLRLGNPADDVYIDIHHVSKGHRPSLKE
jgi:hypothetical protein